MLGCIVRFWQGSGHDSTLVCFVIANNLYSTLRCAGAAGLQRPAEGATTFPDYAFLVSDTVLVRCTAAPAAPGLAAHRSHAPNTFRAARESLLEPASCPLALINLPQEAPVCSTRASPLFRGRAC